MKIDKPKADFKLDEHLVDLPGTVYFKDLQGRYLGCNAEFARLLHLDSQESIVGMTDYQWLEPSLANKISKVDRKVMEKGVTISLEEIAVDVKGQEATYYSKKKPLRDASGAIIGLAGVSIDITDHEKERNEQNIKSILINEIESQVHFMNNTLRQLPENFYWLDKTSRVIGCNENQPKVFGLTREQFIGMDLFDLAKLMGWSHELTQGIDASNQEVMHGKKSLVFEEVAVVDGETKTYLSYKNPLFDRNKKVIGIFGFSIDITQRKNMEQELNIAKSKAESANYAKTQFIMNISHDIRSPFSGIIGLVDMLYREEISDEKKDALKHISGAGKHLLSLLNDIIDIVRLEYHACDEEPLPFNVDELVEKVVSITRMSVSQKPIDLKVTVNDNVPTILVGYNKILQRILLNLLGNAAKFTDEGSIHLQLDCLSSKKAEKIIQIKVTDTGIGIENNKLDVIFDRFTRVSPSYKGEYQGSGLGLWIVKNLVDQIKGDIKVESEVGVKTTFTLTFPSNTPDTEIGVESNYLQPEQTSCKRKPSLGLKQILLVEDEPMAQKIASYLLKDYFNAETTLASSGAEALAILEHQQFDLVLTDVGLPDYNGLVLAEEIKTQFPRHSKTPIIAITAQLQLSDYENGQYPAGLLSIIEKPLTIELCERISNLVSAS